MGEYLFTKGAPLLVVRPFPLMVLLSSTYFFKGPACGVNKNFFYMGSYSLKGCPYWEYVPPL